MGKWLVIGVIVLFLGFLAATKLWVFTPEQSRAMTAERDVIARCRAAQDDPLQDLATRRLMRQGCDKMESDYRAKWGISP